MMSNLSIGWDYFDPNEIGFKELYGMFRLVTEELGQEPIIIDADDLLKHPGDTFSHSGHCGHFSSK